MPPGSLRAIRVCEGSTAGQIEAQYGPLAEEVAESECGRDSSRVVPLIRIARNRSAQIVAQSQPQPRCVHAIKELGGDWTTKTKTELGGVADEWVESKGSERCSVYGSFRIHQQQLNRTYKTGSTSDRAASLFPSQS